MVTLGDVRSRVVPELLATIIRAESVGLALILERNFVSGQHAADRIFGRFCCSADVEFFEE